MSVRFTILGSGSSGNCAYLETPEARLLVDAGFSARQIRLRLATLERSPETLTGILITHEHSDHIQGLATLAAKLNVPVYCNRLTKEAIESYAGTRLNFQVFATGASFEIGDVQVDTFSVPHDAQDPVGFLLRTGAGNIGFLTDLGHTTKLVIERVRAANVLLLEANHDVKMLQDDLHRPWSLKQRILSRHGHLSNEAAANAAEEIANAGLRHLFLGHLSRDCNRPELAHRVVAERLASIGAAHVKVEVTSQAAPAPTFELQPSPLPSPPAPEPFRLEGQLSAPASA
ncbi:MAG: MBL fold metallo-hydrolase [Verrucomicrobia bacterium]|nr:MBL fold metallo-hydrolase [Verrucomicrobiota bacterium]